MMNTSNSTSLESSDSKTPKSNGIGQAIGLFFVSLTLLFVVGIPVQFFSFSIGLLVTLVFCILAPAAAFVAFKGVPLVDGLRLKPVDPRLLLAGCAIGMGGWIVAVGIHQLVASLIGPPLESGFEVETLFDWSVMLFVGAVLPAICEESLFRGAIQGVLERKGTWFAIILAGALFGLFHLDPWRILPAAVLGVMFGWLTVQSQSLIPAIVAHFANNATAISVGYFLGDLPGWLIPVLLVLLVSGLTLVFIYRPKSESNDSTLVSPLTNVPAGLPKWAAWIGGIFIGLAALSVGGLALLIFSIITVVPMADDGLLPHIKQGDQLVLIKASSFAFDMSPGDTITFRKGDEMISRPLHKIEGDVVTVNEGADRFLEIKTDQIVGKMVEVIPAN